MMRAIFIALACLVACGGKKSATPAAGSATPKTLSRMRTANTITSAAATTDLLSAPVQPGGAVTTGVTLPPGDHVVDCVARDTAFTISSWNETVLDADQGTWLAVIAVNGGSAVKRFDADCTYGPGPETTP